MIIESQLGFSRQQLERFATRARRASGVRRPVNVLITSSARVRALNRKFRRQDKATDVLSFPVSPCHGNHGSCAGDIAISSSLAWRQARQFGHSAEDEIKILILHGMLHLAGYDHERGGAAARIMAQKERALRRRFALPLSLLERASRA